MITIALWPILSLAQGTTNRTGLTNSTRKTTTTAPITNSSNSTPFVLPMINSTKTYNVSLECRRAVLAADATCFKQWFIIGMDVVSGAKEEIILKSACENLQW